MATELNARDAKLVQYLNEAYGKEQELIQSLEAHIPMADQDKTYKKRLQEHLRETKRHSKAVERRIKALGGTVAPVDLPGPDVVTEAATAGVAALNRGVALVKGQAHMLRGTGYQEKLLKNAKTEYWNEFEEIATYYAIETFAEVVGDKETHRLAKSIRREEERMARFLEKLIPRLARSTAREEVPAALRNGGRGRKRSASKKTSGSSSARKTGGSSSRKTSGSSSRKSSSSASSRGRASSSSSKKSSSRSTSKRSTKSRAGATAKRGTSARSGGSSRKSSGRKTAKKSGSR